MIMTVLTLSRIYSKYSKIQAKLGDHRVKCEMFDVGVWFYSPSQRNATQSDQISQEGPENCQVAFGFS